MQVKEPQAVGITPQSHDVPCNHVMALTCQSPEFLTTYVPRPRCKFKVPLKAEIPEIRCEHGSQYTNKCFLSLCFSYELKGETNLNGDI